MSLAKMDPPTPSPPGPPEVPPHIKTYHISEEGERRGERTFQNEAMLPPLPLPTLRHTLDLYLASVQPHLSEEEYQVTKGKVESFASGVGPKLHARLQQRQKEKRNWLEDWWLHYAYLTVRDPILPSMNTAGPHPMNLTLWPPSEKKAFEYGSLYLWAFLQFFLLLREERFKPHVTKEGQPLSMEQFRWVFNCTRIPGQSVDSLRSTFKTKAEGDCPLHLVALCNGHIWHMYPWDAQGQPLTPPELEAQIDQIWAASHSLGPGPGVAALTCDNRDTWAKNRDRLKSLSLANMQILDTIETSAFVFVLDESTPASYDEMLWEGLCGDGSNRWADKSLSALLTRNGYGVMNNDHTPYDAMVSVMIGHYQHLLLTHMGGRWSGGQAARTGLTRPQRMAFDLDATLVRAIEEAKETSRMFTSDVKTHAIFFTDYGREFLRPHRLHPDSYVQMALQLAFFRAHGRPAPTYETATTRQFYHGRTETLRSCTPESVSWVKTVLNPNATTEEKRRRLLEAIERHNELRGLCEANTGVDRHLFGLYIEALESGGEIPDLFTDGGFVKSGGGGNFQLSTSTTGYTPVFGGVAAMTKDGYGCFYSMPSDRFNFFISHYRSSKVTDFTKFAAALTSSLQDMRQLLEAPRSSL